MRQTGERPLNNVLALVICVLFLSRCSGSSDSPVVNPVDGIDDISLDPEVETVVPITDPDVTDPDVTNPDVTNPDVTNPDVTNPDVANPDVTDPLVQNSILVNFAITVPAYQSSALQVRLVWGDMDVNASWVGDEYWSASAELPTNTEYTLSIIFYDDNGATELAMFDQPFRTGTNASESVTVNANQFVTDQFDTDGDGVSNLNELIAGTDPFVDEDSLLEIRDYVIIALDSSAVSRFEALITDDRPVLNDTFDIDVNGNGTHNSSSFTDFPNYFLESESATRTNTGNSILWEGSYSSFNGDYKRIRDFTNEVMIVDESTRDYVEAIDEIYYGTYTDTKIVNRTLRGEVVAGTSDCKPTSGFSSTKTTTNRYSFSSPDVQTTSISKSADDLYWRITTVSGDDEPTEYFVRELLTDSLDAPKAALFKCVFVDF